MGMSAVTAYVYFMFETLAERDAGPGCLALHARKMEPRIGGVHPRSLGDTHDGHVRRDRIRLLHV